MVNLWMKDEDGSPSVIVTLVTIAFIVTTIAYGLSIVEKVGALSIRAFDPAAAGAYFGVVLSTYVAHHWVSSRYDASATPSSIDTTTTVVSHTSP